MSQREVIISRDLAEKMLIITEGYLGVIEATLEKPDVTFVKQVIAEAKLVGLEGRKKDAT